MVAATVASCDVLLDVGLVAGLGVAKRSETNATDHRHCQECGNKHHKPEEANDSLYRQSIPPYTHPR